MEMNIKDLQGIEIQDLDKPVKTSRECSWCGKPLTQGQIIHPDCFQEQLREN